MADKFRPSDYFFAASCTFSKITIIVCKDVCFATIQASRNGSSRKAFCFTFAYYFFQREISELFRPIAEEYATWSELGSMFRPNCIILVQKLGGPFTKKICGPKHAISDDFKFWSLTYPKRIDNWYIFFKSVKIALCCWIVIRLVRGINKKAPFWFVTW